MSTSTCQCCGVLKAYCVYRQVTTPGLGKAEPAAKVGRPRILKPKCPRCWNKQPAKRNCGYCGGEGRV